jgi:hypothetical protein
MTRAESVLQTPLVPGLEAKGEFHGETSPTVLAFSAILYDMLHRVFSFLAVLLLSSAKLLLRTFIEDDSRCSTEDLLQGALSLSVRQELCRRRCLTFDNVPSLVLPRQTSLTKKLTVRGPSYREQRLLWAKCLFFVH